MAKATPALALLADTGMAHDLVTYRHDPGERAFGDEAVRALTSDGRAAAGQVFKTLVLAGASGLAVAVVPVPARLSLKAAAAALGIGKAALAEQRVVERATGYVLGAVSPLKQRTRLPTVLDATALTFDRVYISAGRRGWDVALAPGDLARLTDAVVADIQA